MSRGQLCTPCDLQDKVPLSALTSSRFQAQCKQARSTEQQASTQQPLSHWHVLYCSVRMLTVLCRHAAERKPAAALEVLTCAAALLLPAEQAPGSSLDVRAEPALWHLLQHSLVSAAVAILHATRCRQRTPCASVSEAAVASDALSFHSAGLV